MPSKIVSTLLEILEDAKTIMEYIRAELAFQPFLRF